MPTLSLLLNNLRRTLDEKRTTEKGRVLRANEYLTYTELHERTGLSISSIAALMDGVTSNPRPRSLEKLVAVFIEEGVLHDLATARSIWQEAGLVTQFSEVWFQDTLELAHKRGTDLFYSERDLQRVLVKNPRGVTLLDALESTGLVDIENRDGDERTLPPRDFYRMAKQEIVIAGISAHTTIVKHFDELIEALEASKDLRILILRPDYKSFEELEDWEHMKIVAEIRSAEIRSVIQSVKLHGLDQFDNFEMRFVRRIPSFTGIMIDGDINHKGRTPRDSEGQIRVQPTSIHSTQHRGVILQFRKKANLPNGAFDFFAENMRKQWQKGVTLKDLPTDIY